MRSAKYFFKKELEKFLESPRTPRNWLSGYLDYYKTKLQYRLICHVDGSRRRFTIIAVVSRKTIYEILGKRAGK